MTEGSLPDLLQRWTSRRPDPATRDAVVSVLDAHGAYEIPLDVLGRLDPQHDEEVREDLLDSLWTITHPEVVAGLIGDDVAQVPDADGQDQYWRELLADGDDDAGEYTLAYRLLITQHALGQRVSVLIEREGEAITHFKVYGFAADLGARLRVMIGFPTRRPEDPETGPFMRPGDLEDPVFQEYLLLLGRHRAI